MSSETSAPEVVAAEPTAMPASDPSPENPLPSETVPSESNPVPHPPKAEETPQFISDPEKATRVSIKVLDANSLPSSSSSSGDPNSLLTANVWVGGSHEKVREEAAMRPLPIPTPLTPLTHSPRHMSALHGQVDIQDSNRTQTISVKADMDSPRFDTELIFPLSVECVGDMLSGCVVVTLADAPDGPQEPESSTAQDSTLGQIKVPFSTIFAKGKTLSKSVHLSPAFYSLSKTKSMSRKFNPEPKIRLALSFFIGDDEGELVVASLLPLPQYLILSLLPPLVLPDVTKLAKNCTTFTELVHEINKVSLVGASNTHRGRSVSPNKRGRVGRSRSRSRNGTR